jgi:hypothetical protein
MDHTIRDVLREYIDNPHHGSRTFDSNFDCILPIRKPTMTVRPPGDVVEGIKDVMEDIEAPFKK